MVDTTSIIDVGCDHALLDIYLAKAKGIKCTAIDVREGIINNVEMKNQEEIERKLDWEYKFINLSKIEAKTSISKVKQNENSELIVNVMKSPEFLKQENNKLSGAQRGTLIHLCMQNLNVNEEYTKHKIKELIEDLEFKKKITKVEVDNIDIIPFDFKITEKISNLDELLSTDNAKSYILNLALKGVKRIKDNEYKQNIEFY